MSRVPLSPKLRRKIFERDAYTCQYCGRSAPDVVLHIGHVIPVTKGGTNDEDNLVTACLQCNSRKHDLLLDDLLLSRLKEAAKNPEIQFHRGYNEEAEKNTPRSREKAKDIYTYPAIFGFHDDGISIKFPDLPGCLSCADTPAEAMYMARDALSGRLWSDECDHIAFPEPTDALTLKDTLTPEQIVVLVDVDMQTVRDKFGGRVINKMVTMPEWLERRGKDEHLNFSQVIQEALMDKLGIKHTPQRKRKR